MLVGVFRVVSEMLPTGNPIGDITSVHDTVNYVAVSRTCCAATGPSRELPPTCAPIAVAADDLHLRRSSVRCLNLTAPITYQDLGCVGADVPLERINMAAPMLELSSVYGHEAAGAAKGRQWENGRLRAELLKGKEWPLSGSPLCINNEPPTETRCHDVPAGGSNSLLGINLMFLWFYRQHNAVADALRALNPCWGDDDVYYTAREINIAYANQIFYYEYLPEIVGHEFLLEHKVIFRSDGHVDDYEPTLEPRVSIEYVTGTRWFHTIQEGRLKLYTKDGFLYDEKEIVDFTLRTGALAVNNTLQGLTQGAFRQPGADIDAVIDPDMGERILGRLQFASDVLSADILKGRLLGLPPYERYRQHCGFPPAHSFDDLRKWMEQEQVDALARHYESVGDVDVMAGVVAERAAPGGAVPPTLACLMVDQLRRWRQADRFWYEHSDRPRPFTIEQLLEIRKMRASVLLCDHGDEVHRIQRNVFRLPGTGNELVPCSSIEAPDLSAFIDLKCACKTGRSSANPFAGNAKHCTQSSSNDKHEP